MVNLVIDFGNTRTKAGIFKNAELFKSSENLEEINDWAHQFSIDKCLVSSVSKSKGEIKQLLNLPFELFTPTMALPFSNTYKTPDTLGLDRLASVAGATYYFPKKNCLVIDCGTCITYDVINAESQYLGGAISPGLTMRFKALHTFTANLPLVEAGVSADLIGKSTTECINSGVINGILAEINEIVRSYKYKFTNLQLILCGGDAQFFETNIKEDIFAAPDLVLVGLNTILKYNYNV